MSDLSNPSKNKAFPFTPIHQPSGRVSNHAFNSLGFAWMQALASVEDPHAHRQHGKKRPGQIRIPKPKVHPRREKADHFSREGTQGTQRRRSENILCALCVPLWLV